MIVRVRRLTCQVVPFRVPGQVQGSPDRRIIISSHIPRKTRQESRLILPAGTRSKRGWYMTEAEHHQRDHLHQAHAGVLAWRNI